MLKGILELNREYLTEEVEHYAKNTASVAAEWAHENYRNARAQVTNARRQYVDSTERYHCELGNWRSYDRSTQDYARCLGEAIEWRRIYYAARKRLTAGT